MKDYKVKRITCKEAKEYIVKNHYSHGCHNGPSPCYGLFENDNLIGCLMFATPCSENVRASVFRVEHKDSVTELHRLHILDVTPKNTESWFISRCLKLLKQDKPQIKAVLTFADKTEGHEGIIYKATNAYFCGVTSSALFFRDENGRLIHPHQCGINITKEKAKELGWKFEKRFSKNRFLYLLATSKTEKKQLLKNCKYDLLNSKYCLSCGNKIPIDNYYNVCDRCLDKEL